MAFNKDNYEFFGPRFTNTEYCINVPNSDFAKVAYADENGKLYVMHKFKGCRKVRMVPVADYFSNLKF